MGKIQLGEYWDEEKTIEELRKFVEKYGWYNTMFIARVYPLLLEWIEFHFCSPGKGGKGTLYERVFSEEDERRFREIRRRWKKRELEGECASRLPRISVSDAVKGIIELPEFRKCRTKRDIRLLRIRAVGGYVANHKEIERQLWLELAKIKRKNKGLDAEEEYIDFDEYSRTKLYQFFGEELFKFYAKKRGWKCCRGKTFLEDFAKISEIENWKDDIDYEVEKELRLGSGMLPFEFARLADVLEELKKICFKYSEFYGGLMVVRGIPDFACIRVVGEYLDHLACLDPRDYNYRLFFVEVKVNKSTVSKVQRKLFNRIKKVCPVYIFRVWLPEFSFKVELKRY